ncbi:LysR family transcriptional regulator [Labilibaculum sp. A4]|uniref:LysR family transcriptional regulator n=1 Tax=Labilibaculum euxinus TaxID=2686357 RepID=A0A425YBV1_9BACT|nr:hydrogen peroxide-inducible genes activator [Labilibaculum euxinus]MDQ1771451.1 LysR substrate-binding domain-containing protein [Labilibaculum euxinus]MUP38288.1 LysR family transcriptional regulator [Labilibaculum euxinus]MVB07493.1 LysR family transcriptional regulator [Labilibaculum euxinus]MWN76661.1 LysR family transcriptional regulator [Labilibaculum euxinus]
MTLKQLKYALALGRLGSYIGVAKSMGVSQPAVSLQIQALEDELGIILFDRSTKNVEPTLNGIAFLEKAQLLVTESKQLEDFAIQLSEEIQGEVCLGVIPTLSPFLVPLFIDELNKKYPRIKIRIQEAITEDILRGIKTGTFHGGIISTPIELKSNLDLAPLFYERFYLYVSDKHELFAQDKIDISKLDFSDVWLLREGNCFMDQVTNICSIQSNQNGNFVYESNNIDALRRIVEYKGGITFLPELSTLMIPSEQEEMIKEIKGRKKVREVTMVSLKTEVRRNLLNVINQVIKDSVPSQMLSGEDKEIVKTNFIEK